MNLPSMDVNKQDIAVGNAHAYFQLGKDREALREEIAQVVAEKNCRERQLSEALARIVYQESLATGLSDHEAREDAWPTAVPLRALSK